VTPVLLHSKNHFICKLINCCTIRSGSTQSCNIRNLNRENIIRGGSVRRSKTCSISFSFQSCSSCHCYRSRIKSGCFIRFCTICCITNSSSRRCRRYCYTNRIAVNPCRRIKCRSSSLFWSTRIKSMLTQVRKIILRMNDPLRIISISSGTGNKISISLNNSWFPN